MSSMEDKARDLGRAIGQSPEYQAVKRANDALSNNREAVEVLRQMEQLRMDAQRMISSGEQPTSEMEEQLDQLLGKVQGNTLYQAVVVAQENFEKVMSRVNELILDGMQKGSASPIITLG